MLSPERKSYLWGRFTDLLIISITGIMFYFFTSSRSRFVVDRETQAIFHTAIVLATLNFWIIHKKSWDEKNVGGKISTVIMTIYSILLLPLSMVAFNR